MSTETVFGVGGAPLSLRVPQRRTTTAHLGVVYPFISDANLGQEGIAFGTTWPASEVWCFDPFVAYRLGHVSSPNMLILGEVGKGKSATVKTLVAREVSLLGRQAFVVDPKGEYEKVSQRLGAGFPIIKFDLAGTTGTRLNPIGTLPGEDPDEAAQRRLITARGMLEVLKGRELTTEQDSILGWALEDLAKERGDFTLFDLDDRLIHPTETMALKGNRSVEWIKEFGSDVQLLVNRLCGAEFAGMFAKSVGTSRLTFGEHGCIIDISALMSSTSQTLIRVVMVAIIGSLQTIFAAGSQDDGTIPRRLFVLDEGWAIAGTVEVAKFLQASFKLSRKWGVANVLVCHSVTDLGAQADTGTAASKMADNLLSSIQTHIVFGTDAKSIPVTTQSLGLSDTEANTIAALGQGVALWRVNGKSAVVRHFLSAAEFRMIDTDSRIIG